MAGSRWQYKGTSTQGAEKTSGATPRARCGVAHGDLRGCYKIKLRKQGYRLVYLVEDDVLVVLVLAIDRREDLAAYHAAMLRLLEK